MHTFDHTISAVNVSGVIPPFLIVGFRLVHDMAGKEQLYFPVMGHNYAW